MKHKAKLLSRQDSIPLHKALDRVAIQGWLPRLELTCGETSGDHAAGKLFEQLAPGDLVLIGARPGQGKTLMSLELSVEAIKSGRRSVFFTLEYTEKDILDRLRAIGVEAS
ncbi:DnaB-like helicase C-terminal domain-containing protein [Cupriavidus necator]